MLAQAALAIALIPRALTTGRAQQAAHAAASATDAQRLLCDDDVDGRMLEARFC